MKKSKSYYHEAEWKYKELIGKFVATVETLNEKFGNEQDLVKILKESTPAEFAYLAKQNIRRLTQAGSLKQMTTVPMRAIAKGLGLKDVPIDAPPQEGENLYLTECLKIIKKYYLNQGYKDLEADPLSSEAQSGYFQHSNFDNAIGRSAGVINWEEFEERTQRYNKIDSDIPPVEPEIWSKAISIVEFLIQPKIVQALNKPIDYKAAYADKISNVGIPFGARADKTVKYFDKDLSGDEASGELAELMINKYGITSECMLFSPGLRGTRSQCKGISYNVDESGQVNVEKFETSIRAIFMGTRARNEKEFMIVYPILECFKANKYLMCGYMSKSERKR